MTRRAETIPADYFDALYAADPDPWHFRSSDYEREKYQATLDALSRPHYRQVFEVGCSIGVLTRQLAARCDALLAVDGSEIALAAARTANADLDNVRFERRMIPADFPSGRFDLILLSEVLYYLEPQDLARTATCCLDALLPDGEIILCHWLGETDYPLPGLRATEFFLDVALKRPLTHAVLRQETYRLDRLVAR